MFDRDLPFHKGELMAQQRAGAGDIAIRAAPFIRDFMPNQHRAFYEAQPFLVAASCDAAGRVWATILEGGDSFVRSPDRKTLLLEGATDPQDPLAQALQEGADIGVIGIELATRRRNRLSGRTRQTESGLAIDIRQTFGNCPQYISQRKWWRVPKGETPASAISDQLAPDQIARISAADTLFIGSGQRAQQELASNGFDASHRGGEPGFVRVLSPTRLRIPDYSGNNFFNTIGNLLEDPRIGLLFVDFATGGLLHVSGRAEIDWTPDEARDPNILRMIDVTVDAVVERREALSLRWSTEPLSSTELVVTAKVEEAKGITSFHLMPRDGGPPRPFRGGQHLPIALNVPGQDGPLRRTYTLSGPSGLDRYRITVKRETLGQASRHLHDQIKVGDIVEAKPPAGDFVMPEGDTPLVLVSAGVGLTPMLGMLYQVVRDKSERPVWFVHGARNGRQHALGEEVNVLVGASPNARKRVYFSAPDGADVVGRDFDAEGRITAAELLALNAGPDAQYMLCGPAGFMADLQSGLEAAGVGRDQIHSESFGGAD